MNLESHRWWYDDDGKLHVEPLEPGKDLVIPPFGGALLVFEADEDSLKPLSGDGNAGSG